LNNKNLWDWERVNLIDAFWAKITFVLLFLVAAMCALSIYVFSLIDVSYVNGIFYDYGLQYSFVWAVRYSLYSSILLVLFGSSIVTPLLSVGSVAVHLRTRTKRSLFAGGAFALWGVVASLASMVLLYLISQQINGELYSYGLTFSVLWFVPFSSYLLYLWFFQAISAFLSGVSGVGLLLGVGKPVRFGSKAVSFSLFTVGAALIAWASYLTLNELDAYPISLAGLGLLFWGVILAYISRTEYVNRTVMEATDFSYLVTLSQIRRQLNLGNRAVYLPPKYLKNNSVNKVCFITKSEMPLDIESVVHETRFTSTQAENLITAPGNQLARLFEKTLNKSFTSSNLLFFIYNVQKLLVDDLELAQNVEVEGLKNQVKITLENTIYSEVYKEATKYSDTLNSVGVPLTSALACALTNLTNKPIIIKGHEISQDGKRVTIIYVILESEENP
jgi:hypothetical protein